MSDKKLKVVVIDDNASRRAAIESVLPAYVDIFTSGFGDNAISLLRPEKDGRIPKVIILNGEDKKGMGLYTFDWIKNKEPAYVNAPVSVILLIEDEFSDKALDYLEIGDAYFYEGDVEDNEFFSVFAEALDTEVVEEIDEEPLYTEDKSAERLIGKTISAPAGSEDKPQRSILLNMEEQLESLEAAMERGRQKAETIRQIMAEVAVENSAASHSHINPISVLDKRKKELNIETKIGNLNKSKSTGVIHEYITTTYDEDDIPEEFRRPSDNPKPAVSVKRSDLANSLMFGNSGAAGKASAGIGQDPSAFYKSYEKSINDNAQTENAPKKRGTIVVVDDDVVVLRTAKLFLTSQFEVVTCDSGMKAIDYFVKNSADLLFLDTVMPNLDGVRTLSSIRFQPKGSRVPVVYLVGRDFYGTRDSLAGNYVFGTIPKPLTRTNLMAAVEQVWSYRGKG